MIRTPLLLVPLLALSPAQAQSPSPAPSSTLAPSALAPSSAPAPSPSPTPSPSPPLAVYLALPPASSDVPLIHGALERELAVPVVLSDSPATALRVVVEANQCRVSFNNQHGEELTRTIDLPEDPERRAEVIALLVGNLTRDEAADLLAALRAAKAPAAPPALPKAKPAAKAAAKALPAPSPLIRVYPGVNVSLSHPIALYRDSERRALQLELGLVYSHIGSIDGLALSLGALRVERSGHGLALGLFYNRVDGPLRGLQVSGVYSEGRAEADGLVVAGVAARNTGSLRGLGVAGLLFASGDVIGWNTAGLAAFTGGVRGVSIGGAVAVASGSVEGLLVAGLYGRARSLTGLSVSGVVNAADQGRGLLIGGIANSNGSTEGIALSGIVNRTGDLSGAAVSLVNVSGRVRGLQLGLVNVATELKGVQFGLVNLAQNGRIQAQAYGTNLVPLSAGLKFVTGYTYSEVALHYAPSRRLNGVSFGFGGHLAAGPAFVEVGGRSAFSFDDRNPNESPQRIDLHYNARVGLRITSFLEPFLAGGVRHGTFRAGSGELQPEFGAGIALF